MRSNNIHLLAAIGTLVTCASAASGRNHSEIRQFKIEPAVVLPKNVTFDTFGKYCDARKPNDTAVVGSTTIGKSYRDKPEDICDAWYLNHHSDFELFNEDCGDGTFCMNSGCGRWAGKDKMCCTGTPEGTWQPQNTTWLAEAFRGACVPHKDTLKDFKLDSGSKPETVGCEVPDIDEHGVYVATQKNFPVNATMMYPGLKFDGHPQCCSTEGDAIMFHDDTDDRTPPSTVVCIPAVIKSKSGSSEGKKSAASFLSSASSGMVLLGAALASMFAFI